MRYYALLERGGDNMRKLLALFTIIVVIMISVFSFGTAFAESETDSSVYDIYKNYCSQFKDRTPGSDGERQSAFYIMNQLYTLGYTAVDGTSSGVKEDTNPYLQNFTFGYESDYLNEQGEYEVINVSSTNVIAYKRSDVDNAKLLIIGCGYDNAYSLYDSYNTYEPIQSEGAYEYSSAVATVLGIAKKLKKASLNFDVAFAFFGSDSLSHEGVSQFFKDNTQEIIGYINLTSIAAGDYLYAYCDDVSTSHGELVNEIITKFNYDIKVAPFDKKITTNDSLDSDRPYWHAGLDSINSLFMERGIASISLFGYNWDSNCESKSHANIKGTGNDTFEFLDKYYGEDKITSRLNDARDLVVNTVLKNGELVTALESYDTSYASMYGDAAYYGVSIGCIVIVIVLYIVGYSFANKKTTSAGTPDFSTNSTFLNGEGVDNTDDVFGFDDPVEGDRKDIDTDEFSFGDSNKDDSDDDDIFGEF